MKKNTKIGIGVAAVAVLSLAVVVPVLADIEPEDIETAETIAAEETVDETEPSIEETQVEETQVEETQVEETQIDEINEEEDVFVEDSNTTPDFEHSPNFCKMGYSNDGEGFADVVPSDYEDPELRRLAEEYVAQGYFIEDCKYSATHYASGWGGDEYAFCNGFNVADSEDGNNTFSYFVLKATPEEFEWLMNDMGYEVTYNGDQVLIENNSEYQLISYAYDRTTEIFISKVTFLTTGALG